MTANVKFLFFELTFGLRESCKSLSTLGGRRGPTIVSESGELWYLPIPIVEISFTRILPDHLMGVCQIIMIVFCPIKEIA